MSHNSLASSHDIQRRDPPPSRATWKSWLVENLFSSPANSLLTLGMLWFLLATVPRAIQWGLIDAIWFSPDAEACKAAAAGACWAVIPEKHGVMFFGTYPYEERWRGVLVIALIAGMSVLSTIRRLWSWWLLPGWAAVMAAVLILLGGGVFGLPRVGTHQWGGLPLTFVMFVISVAAGLPAGILLALGRRSEMPAIRALCVGLVEIVRGLPLVTVLFMASLMLPLFMPAGLTIDKFLRAQFAMALFFSAYASEVVRGGLQAIPRGQYEAAAVVGLNWFQATTRIILPQALRITLPSMINEIIRAFKNTTFVGIIGLFDMLRATSAALQDPVWVQFSIEAYVFVSLLYFLLCFAMSKYGQRIERDTSVVQK